jgi:alpha-glucosidase
MMEAYGTPEETMGYYGTSTAPGGHFPFNFKFITDINNISSAEDFNKTINDYLDLMTEGRTPNWVVSKDHCVM